MATKGSFYQGSTVYTNTNPAGPASAPLTNTPNPAPSSFYKTSGPILASMMQAGFELGISIPGAVLFSNEWLFGYTFDVAVTFAVNLAGSYATAGVAASGSPVFSLRKNGVQFATLTYSGQTGIFICPVQTPFAVGDLLELVAPASADGTLSRLSITLFGTRI